jgi:hypothetical protein
VIGMNENKYILIEEFAESKTGKTMTWAVRNKKSQEILGFIEWCGAWHQYVFEPQGDTIFNPDCLDYISAFIRERMTERKKESE